MLGKPVLNISCAYRKSNPYCKYTTHISHSCGKIDGTYGCETMRRIMRNCPNWWPEEINESLTRDEGKTWTNISPAPLHERFYEADLVRPLCRYVSPSISIACYLCHLFFLAKVYWCDISLGRVLLDDASIIQQYCFVFDKPDKLHEH